MVLYIIMRYGSVLLIGITLPCTFFSMLTPLDEHIYADFLWPDAPLMVTVNYSRMTLRRSDSA